MNEKFKLIKQSFKMLEGLSVFDEEVIREAVKPIAEVYGAAAIMLEIPFRSNKQIFYLYGDNSVDIVGRQIFTYEGRRRAGVRTVITWISSGTIWDDEDLEDLDFISTTACTLSEKLRLDAMANSYYYIDTVTGVSNNNGLGRFVSKLIRRGIFHQYGCALLDIIGFSYVNKKVGFRTGTKVIKQYASKLKEIFGADELVARPGGDNFIIIFKKSNIDKLTNLVSGIDVKARVNSATMRFTLTARAGIYMVNSPDQTFDNVVSYLSTSLNYAKSYSRTNVVYYNKDVEHKVIEHKEFCQKFKNAIDKNEFYVLYQPKVYTKNNTLYGAEALVRWNNDGKVIYPGDFVEIFEKEHLISALDFYVLEQTCRDLRSWLDNGLEPVTVSVNFSNDHLGDDELVDRIIAIVDKYGIDHHLIEIEMTETVDVYEINRLLTYVNGLHKNGFTVAIDDFGIGYSSLLMLQNISVDVLKIDKAFIAELTGDAEKRENIILRHIINMAEELGVEIVAEGVETDEQRSNLTDMHCHRIQGYFYDKPLFTDAFRMRLSAKTY
ncbi:bifunctional diguanylate cyclase/phosphodiesterase [uncultured Ruminococcus sp.]|uniref:putative bifunctional diguanylate cyclase/phosphodiesterase n=1 Tax=uncultured Ruminococcus sp. TaxID=165186 RepID=UPI0025F48D6C|nr:GGDEF domain-containing phosphodiesterase [uncultured Ruminococcus sp.]